MPRFDAEPTPNPNSLKITTNAGAFTEGGMESFASADEARDHPLARQLFSIPGVVNVFILPQFLTVTKTPESNWNAILPAIKANLAAYFDAAG